MQLPVRIVSANDSLYLCVVQNDSAAGGYKLSYTTDSSDWRCLWKIIYTNADNEKKKVEEGKEEKKEEAKQMMTKNRIPIKLKHFL